MISHRDISCLCVLCMTANVFEVSAGAGEQPEGKHRMEVRPGSDGARCTNWWSLQTNGGLAIADVESTMYDVHRSISRGGL